MPAPEDAFPAETPAADASAAPAQDESSVAVLDAPPAPAPGAPTPANDPALLRRALEGLLFITDRPLSAAELGRLVGVRDQDKIVAVVEELRAELEDRNLGYRLIAVAEGWQMATRPELAPYVRRLFADRATMRLSTASQETLSIIAYKQPLTRAEIEQIRGVEVIAALETLLEKRLVKVVGRKETVGRPLMYGTTLEFLRHFGLRSLEDLPPLDRFAPDGTAPGASAETPAAEAAGGPAPEASVAEAAPLEETSATLEPAVEDASYTRADAPAEETATQEPAAEETDSSDGGDGSVWPK